jgi:catechol 2,3-dioxygenase-like lactoylglutathione lyase family enzyme
MQILINVDVDDLNKATHFYESAFGLKVGRRFGADGVEMLGSSVPIYLLVKAAGTAASSTMTLRRNYDRHWTPVHFDFVVEDIERNHGLDAPFKSKPLSLTEAGERHEATDCGLVHLLALGSPHVCWIL